MKYAVIDIGSNSVRLMLWADGTLYKKLFTTRLAAGMRNGLLADDAMRRTAEAVAACFEEGVREAGRGNTFAFATAAVRTAVNGEEFCGLVKKLCGLTIDVVAGETEALLGALGALGAVGSGDGGMVDIGGASTEVFIRENGAVKLAVSLPVGVVRLKDSCGQDGAALVKEVSRCVSPLLGKRCPFPCSPWEARRVRLPVFSNMRHIPVPLCTGFASLAHGWRRKRGCCFRSRSMRESSLSAWRKSVPT